ncbi:glutamine synthetase-like [Eucyclogobius newberryi]|uniref:glutamine synthetase-like n=1 Tax=Eucyclogobius newberryi TaxID=166745 RepID=UPI003B5C7854
MSLLPDTLCLHRLARMPYLSLPTGPQCKVTYVWINAFGDKTKAKTRTLDSEPQSVQDVPEWYSTYRENEQTFELTLMPVQMFRDPFMLDPNKLVLCETKKLNGTPALGNRRSECMQVMEAVKDQKPWFGFEQEFMLQTLEGLPFGWNGMNILGVKREITPQSDRGKVARIFGGDGNVARTRKSVVRYGC